MKRAQWSALLWLLVLACSPNLGLPTGAQIDCASDGKCPSGLVCQTSIGLCVSPDDLGSGPPTLTATPVTPEYGTVGKPVVVSFDVSKPLLKPPEVWAEIRDQKLSFTLDTSASSGQHYQFEYTATGSEHEGLANVYAKLIDSGGNVADGLAAGHFVIDFHAPGIAFADVQYLPDPANPLHDAVSAAKVGTKILVHVHADEPLGDGGVPSLTASNGNGPALVFDYLPDASTGLQAAFLVQVPSGVTDSPEDYVPTLSGWKDPAGNVTQSATFTDPPIRVRVSAPVLSVDQSQVTYLRSPWGNADAEPLGNGATMPGGPWFEVSPTDPLSPTVSLPANTFTSGAASTAQLRVWTSARKDVLLGSATPNFDGSWPRIALPPLDNPIVYVSSIDEAGNESLAVPLDNAEWVTTTRSNSFGNPNTLTASLFDWSALEPDPFHAWLADGALTAGSGAGDPLVVTGEPAWRQLLPVGPAPTARDGHAMAYDARRGVVYLFGGGISPNPPDVKDELWQWDGRGWTQIPKSGAWPQARWFASMVYDGARDRLLLFGGKNQNTFLNDLWEWNGSSWKQITQAGAWPDIRLGAAMVYDSQRAKTVLYGGSLGVSSGPTIQCSGPFCFDSSVWEWDGQTWQQLTPSTAPAPRWLGEMAYDSNRGRAVLFGGNSAFSCPGSSGYCNDTWEWDGTSWSNPATPTHPDERYGMGMTFDSGRGKVVMMGGDSPIAPTSRSDIWEWDGTSWTTPVSGRISPPVGLAAIEYSPITGRTYRFGDESGALNDVWEFGGSTWTKHPASPGLANITRSAAQNSYVAAYDSARDRVELLYGGLSPYVFQLWEYDGTSWTHVPDAGTWPSARYDVAATYDAKRGRTVMFSGDVTGNNEVWEWSGSAWANLTPASGGPQGSYGALLVYDSDAGVDVLISDQPGVTNPYGDTGVWEWNGVWTNKTPDSGIVPEPTRFASGAYDPTRGVVVVFGGLKTFRDGGLTVLSNDLWEWSGTAWRNPQPTGDLPAPREQARMVYDPNRSAVVMFGGATFNDGDDFNDLWSWDGTRWTNLTPTDAGIKPPERGHHGMVWDSARQRVEVFSGNVNATGLAVDDLWVLDEPASRHPAIQFDATGAAANLGPITGLRVRAECGGSSPPFPGGTDGAELVGWSNGFGEATPAGWRTLGTPNSVAVGTASPYLSPDPAPMIDWQTTVAGDIARYVRSRDLQVSVACRPVGTSGTVGGEARTAMKYVEARVRYSTVPFQ